MNKKITAVTLTALMVLTMFTALVPSATAVEEVSAPYEFMGAINQTGEQYINISSRDSPSILYYDLDDKEGAEYLYFPVFNNFSIPKGELNYSSYYWVDDESTYVAWDSKKYAVIENGTSKWIISEKLVDEKEKHDYLLRVGESLTLPEGWALVAMEIDVDGEEAWMSLTKDGEEVDNEVVSTAENKNPHFVYEEDLGASGDDTVVMNFTVETVFAGMNTNLVKINNIDLISTDTLEIKDGDKDLYDDYVVDTTGDRIKIKNDDDVSLGGDDITAIVGGLFSVRVNEDSTRAGVVKIITEPGIYELIGAVNQSGVQNITATSANNPALLYYDLDDEQGEEYLYFPVFNNLTIPDGDLNYSTYYWEDGESTYVAWSGAKYSVIENGTSKWIISEKLVDEKEKHDYLLRVGESLTLPEGWALVAMEIDVDGEEAWMSLTKDGEEVDNEVVSTAENKNPHFVYEEDLGASGDDTVVMNFTVETVFAGMNTNLVKINNIDLISTDTLEVKDGDKDLYDDYVVDTTGARIKIKNDDDVSLGTDDITAIVGGLFSVRVNEDGDLAALLKVVNVGGVTPTEAPTSVATEDVTEEPTEAATGAATAAPTAAATAAATEAPTPEPTKEPGFEAVFAVAGLLAVAYLVLRQRE